MKYFISIVAIFLTSQSFANVDRCFSPGTAIVFGNGINTQRDEAWISVEKIRDLRDWTKEVEPVSKNVKFGMVYNQTHGLASDLLDCLKQKKIEIAIAQDIAFSRIAMEPYLTKEEIAGVMRSRFGEKSLKMEDQEEHVRYFKSKIRAGNRIELVSHSQGNFYANGSWTSVNASVQGGARSFFKNTQVAAPTAANISGGNYFTYVNDLYMSYIPAAMPANTEPQLSKEELKKKDFAGHSFNNIYLFDPRIRKLIEDDMLQNIRNSTYPSDEAIKSLQKPQQSKAFTAELKSSSSHKLNLEGVECFKHVPIGEMAKFHKNGVWTCVWTDTGAVTGGEKITITFQDEKDPPLNKWITGFDAIVTYSKSDCRLDFSNLAFPQDTDIRIQEWDPKNNKVKLTINAKMSNGEVNLNDMEFLDLIGGKAENQF